MFLLGVAGIPAHIEGVFITTPSGAFEVAEACSGVKFLVAMLAYGALVANLCFRSWTRRILFMIAAIVIPIIANGIRAWGTIYVASLTDAAYATGFDHIVYGWIFFAIVIALLMAAGWRFFDRAPGDPWFDVARLTAEPSAPEPRHRWIIGTGASLCVAAAAFVWAQLPAAASGATLPAAIEMPAPPGWTRIATQQGRPWQPHFAGADQLHAAHYRDAAGRTVDLYVVTFANQREGQELVGYGQGAVGPESPWAWTADADAPPHGKAERIASFGTIREVATFYRIGGILTGNPLEVKIETMKTRLLGRPQRAAAVIVSAESPGEGLSPRPAIDAFLAGMGPVDRLADRALGDR
jgi:EpsI family protein